MLTPHGRLSLGASCEVPYRWWSHACSWCSGGVLSGSATFLKSSRWSPGGCQITMCCLAYYCPEGPWPSFCW